LIKNDHSQEKSEDVKPKNTRNKDGRSFARVKKKKFRQKGHKTEEKSKKFIQ